MKIAIACPYAWDAPGGVQVHVQQLAGRLERRGHRVIVLAPARAAPREENVVAVGRPIRLRYNGSVAPIAPHSARSVRRALEEFGPDVVHAHEPFTPSASMHAARWSRAPVVATFHAYADRSLLLQASARLLRRIWRSIDVRIAVSEAAREHVSRAFRGQVRVIPNGVEVGLFAGAEPIELPAGRRILFVNRLDRRKGFVDMVDAFGLLAATHPDALLVVAGDGKERSAVRRLPPATRRRVVLLGSVPHHLLPPYHASCEVFCAPATGQESFGIVLVEAMAAGLPIVATDIPGYREVVRGGEDGLLVPPADPGAVAGALRRLLDDPELGKRLVDSARSRAEAYSWDAVTRQVEGAYEEAVGGA